jgi:hypothetical protein
MTDRSRKHFLLGVAFAFMIFVTPPAVLPELVYMTVSLNLCI